MGFPKIDPTVNIGHILIMLGMIFSAMGAYISIQQDLTEHQQRLMVLERQVSIYRNESREMLQTLSGIRTDIAVIKRRMEVVEEGHNQDGQFQDRQ